jgi:hypothetical protein
MHHVRQESLPFVGSSYEFVGARRRHQCFQCSVSPEAPGTGPPASYLDPFIREGGVDCQRRTSEAAQEGSLSKAGEVH